MVIYSEFTHWKWWFSTGMLVYQRASPITPSMPTTKPHWIFWFSLQNSWHQKPCGVLCKCWLTANNEGAWSHWRCATQTGAGETLLVPLWLVAQVFHIELTYHMIVLFHHISPQLLPDVSWCCYILFTLHHTRICLPSSNQTWHWDIPYL